MVAQSWSFVDDRDGPVFSVPRPSNRIFTVFRKRPAFIVQHVDEAAVWMCDAPAPQLRSLADELGFTADPTAEDRR
ncbi:hypothetical protein [Candidatus Mycobacterium methanotrophicum]|uniref:hypothetical protein n=1 Tax=Candidatus Mycobacterium methanotrophicum TaxID=2943498 RepID=UPI001C55DAD5|nr:hypothetical protein [Candidatus Mycobacterium methanotrophicum]